MSQRGELFFDLSEVLFEAKVDEIGDRAPVGFGFEFEPSFEFLAVLTVLFYLDRRRQAPICCLVFALLNTGITAGGIIAGERWLGIGFLVAAGAALLIGAVCINHHLQNLDYETFNSQPLYG